MAIADQAQVGAEATVHQQAVKASVELNKLARALQQVGADPATVKEFDDMANAANEVASSVLGNEPAAEAAPANPGSDPMLSPQDDLGTAIQGMHNEMAAAQGPAF